MIVKNTNWLKDRLIKGQIKRSEPLYPHARKLGEDVNEILRNGMCNKKISVFKLPDRRTLSA